MTLSGFVAEWLAEKRIQHSFGIIGGGNVALWDAIARKGYTQLICTHHEQAAAQAAIYYWRTCGRLPLCLVTTGAGSTNALTGVMNAWMDSVPLLVISGNESSKYHRDKGRGFGFQGYRSAEVAAHFTKRAGRLHGGASLDRAYVEALAQPQGPVWLDFPKDLQNAVA